MRGQTLERGWHSPGHHAGSREEKHIADLCSRFPRLLLVFYRVYNFCDRLIAFILFKHDLPPPPRSLDENPRACLGQMLQRSVRGVGRVCVGSVTHRAWSSSSSCAPAQRRQRSNGQHQNDLWCCDGETQLKRHGKRSTHTASSEVPPGGRCHAGVEQWLLDGGATM